MSTPHVVLDGNRLTLEALRTVARGEAKVALSPEAAERVRKARQMVDRAAAGDAAVYGVNTGFGTLAEVRIGKEDLSKLQRNLLLSHAAGVGAPLPIEEARALMVLRANVLAKGYSGVRPETLQLLIEMINRGLVAWIPERGSVGASGDLAPLSHLALTLIGEGQLWHEGRLLPSSEALAKVGLSPIVPQAKEGLALINGTQAICAVGSLTLLRAEELSWLADLAGAMTVEGLMGTHKPFMPRIHEIRPQRGQLACAEHLRRLLSGSEIAKSHESCKKVQDPYSMRCMPQIHGAARDGIRFAREALAIEINSATDNPLVFAENELMVSGGNFHGQPVSLALDVLAIALTQLASVSERRVEQLVNPALSGLPAFLTKNSGLNSGYMIAQVTAAALVVESRILSHPASVDSIPSSASREDHVSMGMTAALKARQVSEHVRNVIAIELLIAAQSIDFRQPLKAGVGVQAAWELIRSRVPFMEDDREMHKDITEVAKLIDSGELLEVVEKATG